MTPTFRRYKLYHRLRQRAWSCREQFEYPIAWRHTDEEYVQARERWAAMGREKYRETRQRMLPLRARLIADGIPARDLPLPR